MLHSVKKIQLYDDESETRTTVYDLIITVENDEFSALSIDGRMCQQVVNSINLEQNLTIWHHEGLIYQLSNQSGLLLSYNYLKAIIYDLQTDGATSLWIVFIWFWLFVYKTATNVIIPGTFKNEE